MCVKSECLPTQVRGADINAVEGGILQHVRSSSSEGGASTSLVTIPGQVCCLYLPIVNFKCSN